MQQELKDKKDALIREAVAREPRIINAKKFILIMSILFLAARMIFVVVETIYVLSHHSPIRLCFLN